MVPRGCLLVIGGGLRIATANSWWLLDGSGRGCQKKCPRNQHAKTFPRSVQGACDSLRRQQTVVPFRQHSNTATCPGVQKMTRRCPACPAQRIPSKMGFGTHSQLPTAIKRPSSVPR